MHNKSNLLKKFIILTTVIVLILINCAITEATTVIEPTDNQYFELKATTITDVAGQNKQVIMELWGYEIDFKRI